MPDKNSQLCDLSTRIYSMRDELGFEQFSQPERVFLCVWELEAEVNHGGFEHYYFYSGGDNAAEAVEALVRIGGDQMAAILSRANALFGDAGVPKDIDERQVRLETMEEASDDPFDAMDREFFDYPDDLTELLHAYVVGHRDQIRGAERFN